MGCTNCSSVVDEGGEVLGPLPVVVYLGFADPAAVVGDGCSQRCRGTVVCFVNIICAPATWRLSNTLELRGDGPVHVPRAACRLATVRGGRVPVAILPPR